MLGDISWCNEEIAKISVAPFNAIIIIIIIIITCVPVYLVGTALLILCNVSAPRAADLRSILAFAMGIFSGPVIPVTYKLASLPGAWRCKVSVGTGWPGVSIQ